MLDDLIANFMLISAHPSQRWVTWLHGYMSLTFFSRVSMAPDNQERRSAPEKCGSTEQITTPQKHECSSVYQYPQFPFLSEWCMSSILAPLDIVSPWHLVPTRRTRHGAYSHREGAPSSPASAGRGAASADASCSWRFA